MPLADARAICPSVSVDIADPADDATALRRLALWCRRYSPWTTVHAPDSLAIEITGCAHLFGGEAALLDDLQKRLAAFRLTVHLAVASTIGAAWAVAHHANGRNRIIGNKDIRTALTPLPLATLRLDEGTTADLAVMGLQRIGDLLDKPRAPITARFGPHVLKRLEQAFGSEDETFHPLSSPPVYRAERRFVEPVVQTEAVEHIIGELSQDLSAQLALAGQGTRSITLELFRVDGHLETLTARTSSLCCTPEHIARLFRERIGQMGDDLDTGFGFDVMCLNADNVEASIAKQETLETGNLHSSPPEALDHLLDRLINRCGSQNLVKFIPRASHMPERAAKTSPILTHDKKAHDWEAHLRALQGSNDMGRPLVLLSPPEPVTALSTVPDGPPIRFVWNRVSHRVTRADGPERIAPEWWLHNEGSSRRTRDYYRVEDDTGRRYWLFRDGLHNRGDETSPAWFMHGLFA
jgi:protein ImuB